MKIITTEMREEKYCTLDLLQQIVKGMIYQKYYPVCQFQNFEFLIALY